MNTIRFDKLKWRAVKLAPTFLDYVGKVDVLYFSVSPLDFSISRIESSLQHAII